MGLVKGSNSKTIVFGETQWPWTSNLKILVAKTDAANRYSCFRELGSATDYVVPAAKSFKCIAMKAIGALVAGSTASISVGYANTAATFGGGGAPTTPIYAVGGGATSYPMVSSTGPTAQYSPLLGFNVPTGKYPFMDDNSATPDGFVMILGYEE